MRLILMVMVIVRVDQTTAHAMFFFFKSVIRFNPYVQAAAITVHIVSGCLHKEATQ